MDAIQLLQQRVSHLKLQAPAPNAEALEIIMQAALRAPDHANLTPWEFIVCENEQLDILADWFTQSAIAHNKSAADIQRAGQLPLRAPMIIVALMRYQEHPKVPRVEQIGSTACAVMAMQMAAFAQGYGGVWRTGDYAHCEKVKQNFGLSANDEIIGYLYLGTPAADAGAKPKRPTERYFRHQLVINNEV